MSTLLVVMGVLTLWCVAPLPLAVAVGRAFRAGGPDGAQARSVAPDVDAFYDAAGA